MMLVRCRSSMLQDERLSHSCGGKMKIPLNTEWCPAVQTDPQCSWDKMQLLLLKKKPSSCKYPGAAVAMAAYNGFKQPQRTCGTRTGQVRVQVSYCSIDRMGKYKSKYKWNNIQLYYSKKKKTFNGIHRMLSSSMHFRLKRGKNCWYKHKLFLIIFI